MTAAEGNFPTPFTLEIAEVGKSLQLDALPPRVVRRTKHCLLDWFGMALNGSTEEAGEIPRRVITQHSSGPSTVLAKGFPKVSLLDAATINGTASHAVGMDDGAGSGGLSHSSSTIMPAALALGEHLDISGAAFLEAVAAGQESGVRVARLVMPEHYTFGFHGMTTVGTFSSASTAAHMMELDLDHWLVALGIAGSESSGLRINLGTMTEYFHAGRAASRGILACLLAEQGFSASAQVLEGRLGYVATHAPTPHLDPVQPLGDPFVVDGVLFKYHAACSGTQAPINAIQQLKAEFDLHPGDVREIRLRVSARSIDVCDDPNPTNGPEAKLSHQYTCAIAMLGLPTDETGFSEAQINRPDVQGMMKLVVLEEAPFDSHDGTIEVDLLLHDGRKLHKHLDFKSSKDSLDDEAQKLHEKFLRVTNSIISRSTAEWLIASISEFENIPSVTEFLKELASRG